MSEQMTLGELIDALEPLSEDKLTRFDFEYAKPTTLKSWRGVYAELAIGFTFDDDNRTTVKSLLSNLKQAVGNSFTGYKGGEFVMNRDTPLWVANVGNVGTTAVVGVIDIEYEVIVATAHCDRWS